MSSKEEQNAAADAAIERAAREFRDEMEPTPFQVARIRRAIFEEAPTPGNSRVWLLGWGVAALAVCVVAVVLFGPSSAPEPSPNIARETPSPQHTTPAPPEPLPELKPESPKPRRERALARVEVLASDFELDEDSKAALAKTLSKCGPIGRVKIAASPYGTITKVKAQDESGRSCVEDALAGVRLSSGGLRAGTGGDDKWVELDLR